MSKLANPIDYIDQSPLARVKAPRSRLKRFAWNLEVVREQVPEGFDIKEAQLCLGADNHSYISAQLNSKNPLRLHAVIRGLMRAQRIDRGGAGLYSDHVTYDDRGRAAVLGDSIGVQRVPEPQELRPGLDIRTIYATGTPPMEEERQAPTRKQRGSFLKFALIGGATTAAGIATWLWLRGHKGNQEDPPEIEEEGEEPEETETQEDSD